MSRVPSSSANSPTITTTSCSELPERAMRTAPSTPALAVNTMLGSHHGVIGVGRDRDRRAGQGTHDGPRPDEQGHRELRRSGPQKDRDADAKVTGDAQERGNAPGEADERCRGDQVQSAVDHQRQADEGSQGCKVQLTESNATPAAIPTPPMTASFHGVGAGITQRP